MIWETFRVIDGDSGRNSLISQTPKGRALMPIDGRGSAKANANHLPCRFIWPSLRFRCILIACKMKRGKTSLRKSILNALYKNDTFVPELKYIPGNSN